MIEVTYNSVFCLKSETQGRRESPVNVLFDNEKLLKLIDNLYILTGIRANIYDASGNDACISSEGTSFCRQIQSTQDGYTRCVNCDRRAIAKCRESGEDEVSFYRCHAGICEAVLPILTDGRPLAYVVFGQFLDSTPRDDQWQRTLATLDWYHGSIEELRKGFDGFRQYSQQEIDAYLDILKAMKSYIYLTGMIYATEYTNQQRLEMYLNQHYMEKLSLASISKDLKIGRTKLCELARTMPGGMTLSQQITQRRVKAAKSLLLKSDMPISEVGDAVGISDYNYFTKVFRNAVGMTPSAFRKQGMEEAGPSRTA